MKRLLVLFCGFLLTDGLMAQAVQDSVYLNEITIWGQPATSFAAGTESTELTPIGQSGSMAGFLSLNTSIYFKTYGNGQLSSISLRGTSANHTSVMWNGLPVNSPTLGQSDFSVWPSFFSEKIGIQKGSASAIYGSGSIGGTVLIDNSTFPKDSILSVGMEAGSFGWQQYSLKFLLNGAKISHQTKLIYSSLQNNFKYDLKGTSETRTQQNASVESKGIDEKIGWSFGDHNFIANLSFVENWRELQPSKTGFSTDELVTTTLRAIVMHDVAKKQWLLHNSIGFIQDATLFNENDKTSSRRMLINNQLTKTGNTFSFRLGQLIDFTEGKSDNYARTPTQWAINLNGSLAIKTGGLTTSVNARQHFSKDEQVLSPSVGANFMVVKRPHFSVKHRVQLATGFRIPTFNDRYWIPGGNPDLLLEKSRSIETGQSLELKKGRSILSFEWDIFMMSVNDWILWLPGNGGIFSPVNVQRVLSRGIEGQLSIETKGSIRMASQLNYTFTRSTEESGELTKKGNQLPYTPLHQLTHSTTVGRGKWNGSFVGYYTSRRFTTLDNTEFDSVDPILTFDFDLRKQWKWGNQNLETGFAILNILDSDYENLKNRAMPGRNFKININFKL